jgi:alpha-N-arabinofuranosidase
LFAHVDAWQWTPDLIWFDNLKSYGTPNYYVQKLFSNNKGTDVIPMLSDNAPLTGQYSLYASAVLDKSSNEIVMKLVNAGDKNMTAVINIAGAKKLNPKATMTILKANTRDAVNSIESPTTISPVDKLLDIKSSRLELALEPMSFYVVRIKQSR